MTDIQENQKDNIIEMSDGTEWDMLIDDLKNQRNKIKEIIEQNGGIW